MNISLYFLNQLKLLTWESVQNQKKTIDKYSPIRDVFVHFLDKMKEAKCFLKKLKDISPVIEEILDKQQFLETSEVYEVKAIDFPHHWF